MGLFQLLSDPFGFFAAQARKAAQEEAARARQTQDDEGEIVAYADLIGFAFGVRNKPVDFDRFARVFKKKFPKEDPSVYEISFIKGHQRGLERTEYALAHGAKREPTLVPPLQKLAEDEGISL